MTFFMLKALESMAALLALYINTVLTIIVLSVLCPPLVPLSGIFLAASFAITYKLRVSILATAERDIKAAECGQLSMFEAGCSAVAAGFSAMFFYPSTTVYEVCKKLPEIAGDHLSAMLSPSR